MTTKEKGKINFRIVTDEYDNSEVKRQLQLMIDDSDFYCRDLKQRIPNLITSFKDKIVHDNPELVADILIVDDEVQCIVQYFKTIEQFADDENYPVKNVIACTKSLASHVVFDCIFDNASKKISKEKPAVDPKLVLMDFDLREQNTDNNFVLTNLVKKVFSLWQQYEIDIVGVSAYAFTNDQRFSPFQQWLRDGLIYTFPKDPDLWDEKRMKIHFHNYLLRNRDKAPKEETRRKEGAILLEKIEEKHGKKNIDSTVILLDAIENAITLIETAGKEVSTDTLAVLNKDGTTYTKKSFEVEVGKKCPIIADLLNNRKKILHFDSRWDRFIHHVKAENLFAKKLKALISEK